MAGGDDVETASPRGSRPAIKMRAVTKPPLDRRQPTAPFGRQALVRDAIDRSRTRELETELVEPLDRPRSDRGLMIVLALLVLGIAATIAVVLRTSA